MLPLTGQTMATCLKPPLDGYGATASGNADCGLAGQGLQVS
jgi:hypothetical protein